MAKWGKLPTLWIGNQLHLFSISLTPCRDLSNRYYTFLLQWNWFGSTLNPDYEGNPLNEMIPDDRLMRYTPDNWLFGYDFTGDIRQYNNHLHLVEAIPKENKVQSF